MVSNMGMELPIVVDPYLNWKTSSKGRQRTVRRPRTSFSSGKSKRSTAESLKESGDLIYKEPKRAGGTLVSEFEKLGVSILGRRFCDTIGFVPYKKNRVRSPSPPSQLSSHLHELGQEKITSDGKANLKEINEKICELPDFSGISLLAAVACDSKTVDDIMQGSVSKSQSSEGGVSRSAESHFSSEIKVQKLSSTSGGLDIKTNTISSLHNVQSTESREESSFRSDRLHWDLNIAMELWEHPHEVVNANSPDADVIGEDDIHDDKLVNKEPCQGQVGLGYTKHAPELVDSRVHSSGPKDDCALEGTKILEKPVFSCDCSVEDQNEEKDCVSVSHVDDSTLEEYHFGDAPVAKINIAEEKELLYGLGRGSFVSASTSKKEKADAYHVCIGSMVENETTSSHQILSENASMDLTTHASEVLLRLDQRTIVVTPEKNIYSVSVADLEVHSGGCPLANGEIQAENNTSLHIDSEMDKIDQRSFSRHFTEYAFDDERNSASPVLAHNDDISAEVAHIDALDNNARDHIDNSKLDMSSCLSDSSPFTCQGTSKHDELSSGSTSVGEHVGTANTKIKLNKCSMVADKSLDAPKYDAHFHTGSKISICASAGTLHGNPDAPPLDGALSSHEICKSYVDSYVNSTGEVALEDHSDCNNNSYASQTCNDQATGLEKVELLSDDDSQYEDGEFRGSIIISWGEDETEDGETEFVDYGSRTVVEDAALHVDNTDCKNVGLSEVGNRHVDSQQLGKYAAEISGAGYAKGSAGKLTRCDSRGHHRIFDGIQKFERNANDAMESGAGSDKVIGPTEISKESDGARESIHSGILRLKSSGWDQFPEGWRSSRNGVMDSGFDTGNKNQTAATLVASSVGESLRRVVGSTSTEDLSSRVERPKSSEVFLVKGKSYTRASRSDDANKPNFEFGDADNDRSFRRDTLPLRMHPRGRGDRWVDSPNNWDHHRCRDSPGYNGPPSFTHHGSKDAVATVAAKLESNGFVIAPDGTIIKAGVAGPTGCAPRRSINASPQRTCRSVRRRSPIERDEAFGMPRGLGNLGEVSARWNINVRQNRTGRYGPGVVRTDHRERYRDLMPNYQPLSRREQSFSPRRRPFHLSRSHTRSPSRSRTRSPTLTPPREGSDHMMTRSPGLRWRSRSPSYFRSEVVRKRMPSVVRERTRSPHQQHGFKHMVRYAPSARNHASSPHASRRIYGRKGSPYQIREHDYMRSSGRKPPTVGLSQGHSFDSMDSPKRSKPDECY